MLGPAAPKRVRVAVNALAILTALALFTSGWALFSRFQETDRLREESAHVWRSVICTIEQSVIADDMRTLDQKRKSIEFYDNLLINSVRTFPCGLLQNISNGGTR